MVVTDTDIASDYDFILSFLPEGWEKKAKELGALRRCRKIPDAKTLLHIMLIHLAGGCSLRETAVQARLGGIADVTDVAILARLKQCGEWFRWMNERLIAQWVPHRPCMALGENRRPLIVDATKIAEPGPTGSTWTALYSIELPSLRCRQFYVLDYHNGGETFRKLIVQKGDVLIADRVYGSAPGIAHVVKNGGDVIVRFAWSNLVLWASREKPFDLFAHLKPLRPRMIGDWPVWIQDRKTWIPGRVCAIRKSRRSIEEEYKRLKRRASRHGQRLQPETLEAAKYVMVFTTLPDDILSRQRVLEFYRGRWQVELVFKRLKSIMGLSHLRKIDPDAAYAWIQGKLLVSILIEVFISYGESFFPWGYPLECAETTESLAVEGASLSASIAPDYHFAAPQPQSLS